MTNAIERQLLEILLAELTLAPIAFRQVKPRQISHPGLFAIYAAIIAETAAAVDESPTLEGVIGFLAHRPDLAEAAEKLAYVGRQMKDRPAWLTRIAERFADPEFEQKAVQTQLEIGSMDDAGALELLRKLQKADPVNMEAFHRLRKLPVKRKAADRNVEYQPSLETYTALGMFDEQTYRFIDGTEATNAELYPGDE